MSTATIQNRPGVIVSLACALAYGGGAWLHTLHRSSHQSSMWQWLRDSSLMLPLTLIAVLLASFCVRLAFRNRAVSVVAIALMAPLAALFASTAAVAGSPLIARALTALAASSTNAATLFVCSLAGVNAAPAAINTAALLRDGLLLLPANLLLASIVLLLVRGRIWRDAAGQAVRPTGLPHIPRLPRLRLPRIALHRRSVRRRYAASSVSALAVLAVLPFAEFASVTPANAAAPPCRTIYANVVALDQTLIYNRLGVIDPEGTIFALRQDVVDKTTGISEAEGAVLSPGNVMLRSDKRPRPLTLRMNVGDCLQIRFQNLLGPAAIGQIQTRSVGISVIGMQLKDSILSDGSNVGQNAAMTGTATAGLAAPGGMAQYTFYAEREGGYELYSPTDNVSAEGIGVLAHGMFGAINVEPTGAEWYRSQITRDEMDLATPAEPFRDTNGNGIWDAELAEPFSDINGNSTWDAHRTTADGHPIIDYDAIYPIGHRFAGKPILNMLDSSNTIIHSDLTAVITGAGRGLFRGSQPDGGWYPANPTYPDRNQPFREFTIVFHDESAVVQAFPEFSDPSFEFTLHGVRDGKGINYGTGGIAAEVLSNRKGVGPAWNCPECKLEEFFLTSWVLGDSAMIVDVPANTTDSFGNLIVGPKATKVFYPDDPSNVYHTYINDHTKFRNIHVGTEHHIFHLHSHQWLETPDDDNSSYLDSQAVGPGSSYTYEIAYDGSGNRNKTPGDSIFHCHFYPHFAQGMWAMWRSHDTFERGTQLDANGIPLPGSRALPDGEIAAGTPIPALVPLPGIAMAPMPDSQTTVVPVDSNGDGMIDSSQVDADGNGTADYLEGFAVAPTNNPGYPYYIPGIAGHRPPTPALDMTEPLDMNKPADQRRVYDGGLPRHVITGGVAIATTTPFDLSKVVESATAIFPAEDGTAAEKVAMAYHAQFHHDTYTPDGAPATGTSGYKTNGLPPSPGAPYAEPCRLDNGTFNSSAPQRVYKAATIQLDMKLNKLGWHFPQARMLALWQDVGPTLNGSRAPEPFVMRANSGDCMTYYHTNLIPGVYEQDAYQVRTPTDIIGQHIHLVKFDVTASDGSANGFNYEDGALSPDEVRERIDAIRHQNACSPGSGAPGNTTCPVAAAHPFFGAGPNSKWLGARTTIQRWWADPVLNAQGLDRTLGNVYTHDHYGPSTHQQTGLYATLIIEPSKSLWRDGETGMCHGDTSLAGRPIPMTLLSGGCTLVPGRIDGGPTSWRADVLTAENAGIATRNYDQQSFREFYFEFSDFQHAYAQGRGATFGSTTITIGGKSYTINVPTAINPEPLYAINPPGSMQNPQITRSSPWLMTKPALQGQANICPSHPTALFTDRGCPEAISTADIGTFSLNYRNEPLGVRLIDPATMAQANGDAGDPSLAFSSRVVRKDARLNKQPVDSYPPLTADVQPNDPYTPLMRAYENDKVRIKVQVGATEEGHNASLWGSKWLQEFASPNSGWRNSQMMGISEQFNWDMDTAVDPTQKGRSADTIFSPDNSVDGLWNGMWSLMRTYARYRVKLNALGTDLLPLPNNRIDTSIDKANSVSNLNEFDRATQYQCPINAPKAVMKVTAVLARDVLPSGTLTYNSRAFGVGPLHDPTAILYVRSTDLNPSTGKLKPGIPIEPLILRARAGDCINLQLTNNLPSSARLMPDVPGYNMFPPIVDRYTIGATAPRSAPDTFNANGLNPSNRVGLRPQLVAYDVTRGAGNSIGGNVNMTVAAGASKSYWWYAGDLRYNSTTGRMTATPVEFGATNLISSDPLKHSNKGAIGALIIEPQGSTWLEDSGSRAQATVTTADGSKFRDFVLIFQDDINMRFGLNGRLADGGAVPYVAGGDDAEDSGMKGINYRTEPLWYRMGIDPAVAEDIIMNNDFTNVLSNSQVGGDPQTPILTASPGQAIRLRVLEPSGHARNHVFVLHGHVWARNPYTCTPAAGAIRWDQCANGIGSTKIGENWTSQWIGSQEGHGPTDHWDIIPQHGAGGAFAVAGDYLYRDMASYSYYNGVWGILRVR